MKTYKLLKESAKRWRYILEGYDISWMEGDKREEESDCVLCPVFSEVWPEKSCPLCPVDKDNGGLSCNLTGSWWKAWQGAASAGYEIAAAFAARELHLQLARLAREYEERGE